MKQISTLLFIVIFAIIHQSSCNDFYRGSFLFSNQQNEVREIKVEGLIPAFFHDALQKSFDEGLSEKNTPAFKALKKCCIRLKENQDSLLVQDLLDALPILKKHYKNLLSEFLKAPRESIVPSIVGPGGCDIGGINNSLIAIQQLLSFLEQLLQECCNAIAIDFQGTWTALQGDFQATWSILADTICQAISITTTMVITQPGRYCLENDVVGEFIINANDVVLDLNSHVVSSGGVIISPGINRTIVNGRFDNSTVGITLSSNNNTILGNLAFTNSPSIAAINGASNIGTSIFNVFVQNCLHGLATTDDANLNINQLTIVNPTDAGITLTNCSQSVLNNIMINNGTAMGISLTTPMLLSVSGISINNCVGFGLSSDGVATGCRFERVQCSNISGMQAGLNFSVINNSAINSCSVDNGIGTNPTGIYLGGGSFNTFDGCFISNLQGGSSATGIFVNGPNNIVSNCMIQNIVNSGATGANGINSQASNNEFHNCKVNGVIQTTNPNAVAAGFLIGTASELIAGNNIFIGCSALDINSVGDAYGFQLLAPNGICKECLVGDVNGDLNAAGFFISNLCIECTNCNVNNVSSLISAAGFYINGFTSHNVCSDCDVLCVSTTSTAAILCAGFVILLSSDDTCINCRAQEITGVSTMEFASFFADDVSNVTFQNCTAYGGSYDGFYIFGQGVIQDCVAYASGGNGFKISGNNAIIEGSTANSCIGDGFQISGNDGVIQGCAANMCDGNGFNVTGTGQVIKDSTAHFCGDIGFSVIGPEPLLENCEAKGCTHDGISISGPADNGSLVNCLAHINSGNGFTVNGQNINVQGCNALNNQQNGFITSDQTSILNFVNCRAGKNTDRGFFDFNLTARLNFLNCVADYNGQQGFQTNTMGTTYYCTGIQNGIDNFNPLTPYVQSPGAGIEVGSNLNG